MRFLLFYDFCLNLTPSLLLLIILLWRTLILARKPTETT